jgi:hypothetical protein
MTQSKLRTEDPTDYDGRTDARDLCTHVVINKLDDLEIGVWFPAGIDFSVPHSVSGSILSALQLLPLDCLNSGKAAVAWNCPYLSSKEA